MGFRTARWMVLALGIWMGSFASLYAEPASSGGVFSYAAEIVRAVYVAEKLSTETQEVRLFPQPPIDQTKLVVAKSPITVDVTRTSENWRGMVSVRVTVPCDVSYAVDLSQLRQDDVQWDAKTKLMRLQMPRVEIDTVTPNLKERSTTSTYSGWRFKYYDGSVSSDLEDKLLDGVQNEARKLAREQVNSVIKSAARDKLQNFVRKMIQPAVPDAQVVVE